MARRAGSLLCSLVLLLAISCQGEEPYSDPGADLKDTELVGVWTRTDVGARDEITLRGEDTYRQVYTARGGPRPTFERPWETWRVERLPSGRTHLRFRGARLYRRGTYGSPLGYSDPMDQARIHADADAVVVVVLRARAGRLVLVLPTYSPDEGWIYLGNATDAYRSSRGGSRLVAFNAGKGGTGGASLLSTPSLPT